MPIGIYERTAEHGRNISNAKKGKRNPNYGKPRSVETKRKISNALKGIIRSEETRKRMREGRKGLTPFKGKTHTEETKRKLSESCKGKKHSEKTKEKISKTHRGSRNPSWMGGKSFEPYTPEFNNHLKEKIRKRDNYTCQLCGKTQENSRENLTVHHIDYNKKNCNENNLITLCRSCNGKVNFDRTFWTQYFSQKIFDKQLMIINLEKFAENREVIVPIVKGRGYYEGRKFRLNASDGWYLISLGNKVEKLRRATPVEIIKTAKGIGVFRGYPYGAELIPLNFSDARFRYDYAESIPVHFMSVKPWVVVKCTVWNKELYYFEVDKKADYTVLNSVRKRFESEEDLSDLKGVTPELRYLYILYSLQRDNWKAEQLLSKLKLEEEEKEKRREQFKRTFSQRIKTIIEGAGGHLKQYYPKGESDFIVVWTAGTQTLKTLITRGLKVKDLGYCASGEDKKHSLSSAVAQAQIYQKDEGSVYITRE